MTEQTTESAARRVFADPVGATEEEQIAAGRELEASRDAAMVRLRELRQSYAERSLQLHLDGDMDGAHALALAIQRAETDVKNLNAAIRGANAKLDAAALEAMANAEKEQWHKVESLLVQHKAAAVKMADACRNFGEAFRDLYSLGDTIWAESPRKPGNRNFVPLFDEENLRNNVELMLNQCTGGMYPGLGDLVPGADIVGACEQGQAHILSMRPGFSLPAGIKVTAEDFAAVVDRLGNGAQLTEEGWRMPGSFLPDGYSVNVGEVDWDAVDAADQEAA
jgi:hypothetical protein